VVDFNDLHLGLKLGHFSLKIGHFKNVGAQFRTVERPAESLAAVRLDAWAQGRADASLPALVLHGLHADRPAPSRPPHARERLRGGFDVWGDDGDADDAERGDAVVEKRGERAQSTSARP
jgi:hypothetical protein